MAPVPSTVLPCPNQDDCGVCLSFDVTCTSDDDCDAGESCKDLNGNDRKMCISNESPFADTQVEPDADEPDLDEEGSPGEADTSLTSTGSKLNLEECFESSECAQERQCFAPVGDEARECDCGVCWPADLTCTSDAECDAGESCTAFNEDNVTICASNEILSNTGDAELGADEPDLDEEESPTGETSSTSTGDKLNFELCSASSECTGDRVCFTEVDGIVMECFGQDGCRCFSFSNPACFSGNDCEEGESCVMLEGSENLVCVSNEILRQNETAQTDADKSDDEGPNSGVPNREVADFTPSPSNGVEEEFDDLTPSPSNVFEEEIDDLLPSPSNDAAGEVDDLIPSPSNLGSDEVGECESNSDCEPDEVCTENGGPSECTVLPSPAEEEADVCISAHHLTELNADEVLYSRNRWARVLCDEHSNCATPGHIVTYDGTAMMMRRYCELAGCTEKTHRVNSLKYVRGKLLKSNSDGLLFTSLAARYGSRMEEAILAFAVRVGF
ncbi:hypothetical protein FGB62_317g03 [Gracilaria domingensis]|nr:hypothetical protein FGB62_317g03 [Gracilaria domingensis]